VAAKEKSCRELIREALLARIGSGELEAGERIVEARLAEEFAVSTIPVREAIRELVAMGLLEFEAHRGARVRKVQLPETIDALNARAALEPLAAAAAAERLRGRCAALRKCVEAIVAAARARDFRAFQRHNQSLHRAIFEASGSTVLLRIWDSLAFEVRTRIILEYLTTIDPVAVAEEHWAIVDAFDRGDAAKAAALLQSHSRALVRYLSQRAEVKRNGRPAKRKIAAKEKDR
jgi:DNA-binding GntR family transcriptional regulator